MCKDYDPSFIVNLVEKYLPKNSSIFELGLGAGIDFKELKKSYNATSSDYSQIFIDLYKENFPQDKVLFLDAKNFKLNEPFDSIFSNKVLIHLSKDELKNSIKCQHNNLNKNGIVFHTFWRGEGKEIIENTKFVYYEISSLKYLFYIKEINYYTECEENDSIYLVAQKIQLYHKS